MAALAICGLASQKASAAEALQSNFDINKATVEKPDFQQYLNEATVSSATYSSRKEALLKALSLTEDGSTERLSVIYKILTFLNATTARDQDFPDQVSLCKQALPIAEHHCPQVVPEWWLRLAAYQAKEGDFNSAQRSAQEGFQKLDKTSNVNNYGILPPFGLTYLLYKGNAGAQAKTLMKEAISRTEAVYGADSKEANLQKVNKFEMLVRHGEYNEARPALTAALEHIDFTLPRMLCFCNEAPLHDLQRIYFCAVESVREHDCRFAEFVINKVLAREKAKLQPDQSAPFIRNGMHALAHCYYKAGLYRKSYETYAKLIAFEKAHQLKRLADREELQAVYKKLGKQPEGEYAEEKTVTVDGTDKDDSKPPEFSSDDK